MKMHEDMQEILLKKEKIEKRIEALGRQITREYKGKPLLVVGILRGSFIFLADLIRHISLPLEIDFMVVSSYGVDTKTSGVVRILKDLNSSDYGKHILLVEDIVDTGLTMKFLCDLFSTHKNKDLKICTLLDKPSRRQVEVNPDFIGFTIEDKFVVGYGLDYQQKYRNVPYIGVLKPSFYGDESV